MDNVMIDLETLDTKPTSMILTIGAVAFDVDEGLGQEFYSGVRLDFAYPPDRLSTSGDTILWWLQQSDAARARVTQDCGPSAPWLDDMLWNLSDWFEKNFSPEVKVWGNGASFDNAILANAYGYCGETLPWKFYNDRCYRTLKNLYPAITADPFEGVQHNALDDAKHQARHAIKLLHYVRGRNDERVL